MTTSSDFYSIYCGNSVNENVELIDLWAKINLSQKKISVFTFKIICVECQNDSTAMLHVLLKTRERNLAKYRASPAMGARIGLKFFAKPV